MENENTKIEVFNFKDNDVRVINKEGNPWFVAKDVAEILEYADAYSMTRRLDEDDFQNHRDGGFGNRGVTIISEAGLYNAILGSKKAEAKAFKKWVVSIVLPSIRKTGGYIHTTENDTPELIMARALEIAKSTIERHEAKLLEANNQIKELAPDAQYTRDVIAAKNLHTVNEIAVHCGISAIKLNKFLEIQKWIYRAGGVIYPFAEIRDKNYCAFQVVPYSVDDLGNTKTRSHLKWTELGRRKIIELWNKFNVMG